MVELWLYLMGDHQEVKWKVNIESNPVVNAYGHVWIEIEPGQDNRKIN